MVSARGFRQTMRVDGEIPAERRHLRASLGFAQRPLKPSCDNLADLTELLGTESPRGSRGHAKPESRPL